jgi:transglutaminase-like putative cysteine protease
MTAATATIEPYEEHESWLSRLAAGPAEGWLTLAGVAVMVVALGWSIDDVRYVNGVGSLTDFLPLAGLAGVVFGFAGPKLGWGRWSTHLIGIAFAAMILPIIAGGIVLGDTVTGFGPAALAARYHKAAEVVYRVWLDLAINGRAFTNEYGHYFIALGALMWATGQYAAYAVFGHRRALDAVLVTGLVLLGNMALAEADQLHLMVLFSLAALTLLSRSHAFDERVTWLRRRIGDPATVTGLYLRGGAVFISGAVLGSLFLTATASSAPLQGLWRDVPGSLVSFSQWLQRYVPLGGDTKNPGFVSFGENAAILGSWTSSNEVAFQVRLPASETEQFWWKVGTYSDFDLTYWSWGPTTSAEVQARDTLLADSADDPTDRPAQREVRFEITREGLVSEFAVSPETILSVDQPATVRTTRPDKFLAAVQLGAGSYTVTAVVPVRGQEPGAITANRLRVASQEYSSAIKRTYIDNIPVGATGPAAEAILDTVLARTPANNPYDIAKTMEAYLQSNFRYDIDISDEIHDDCDGISMVECFARVKAGFCQYYASTMAILLREAGIPTRLAQGFLPGQRSGDGTETVRQSGAHAWVEVYFPDYGWVPFNPTGNGRGALVAPPSGPPETATPRPSGVAVTDNPNSTDAEGPDQRRSPGTVAPGGPIDNGPRNGPFIAIAVLLVIGALALAYVAWKRGPRPMHPDRAWGSIGRWAGRFGLAPRASQTVYEYAGVLGDALPIVRPELSTVANAKVEISYARRDLGEDRLRAVAEAHRRLRLGLIRLLFRRPRRRPFRRSK